MKYPIIVDKYLSITLQKLNKDTFAVKNGGLELYRSQSKALCQERFYKARTDLIEYNKRIK